MSDPDLPMSALADASLIRGRYEPVAVLGRGGQGEVLRARDRQHDRDVALKVRPVHDDTERQALLAEARILLSLRPHANLPLVREDFFWRDRYVLVMDFVEGADLGRVLTDSGDPGLPVRTVADWLAQSADALGHLHAQGVVHGDVKPANLVLTPDGRVILVDFGIARRAGESSRRHFGTPGYAAPELHTGGLSPASDIYGLAATAVALLTGAVPTVGRPGWEGVPHAAAIERAVRRGLAIDPRRRPRTAADLVDRLRSQLALDLPTGIVTFLLTDVEGSTARWEDDPEGMAELMARHDAVLADAIESHEGRLLKARGEGDASFSVFARSSDAVAAALGAQRALVGMGLPVRMAVHTGEAEVRDGDYYGRTVNRASRLRSIARAGQIVLSGAAAELAGHALPDGAAFEDLGFQQLRDLARGEQIFALVHPDLSSGAARTGAAADRVGGAAAVEWPAAVASSRVHRSPGEATALQRAGRPPLLPPSTSRLPTALSVVDTGAFVGRRAEIDRLAQVWETARAGERRLVLVGGESGIGKTHLTAAMARSVLGTGGAVVYGCCDEGLQIPYQPFAAALSQALDDATDAGGVPLVGRHASELTRLVPHLADRLPSLSLPTVADPETDQHRLFDAVADWLRSVTSRVPLLVVLDDLHWATRPTLHLLRHLLHTLDTAPLLVLGTYRDTDTDRSVPLEEVLVDLHRLAGVERIVLGGLGPADVVELLENSTGRALAPAARALMRAIRAETAGNPFFVRQFLRHLVDNGTLVSDEQGRWTVETVTEPLGVPAGVREVMARRLGRLSDEALRGLEVAAVAGTEFDLPVVATALGRDEELVLTGLEEAVAARLVVETGPFQFQFPHTIVRSSIVDGLARARHSRLHRSVAESIERVHAATLEAHFTDLAQHYAEAGTETDAERALDYATRAGDAARDRLAYDEAIECYQLALDLLDRTGTRAERQRGRLLVMLGRAQRLAGLASHRQTLLDAGRLALTTGDAELVAAAALANRRPPMGFVYAADEERVALLEAAVDLRSGGDSTVLARLLANLAYELGANGDWTRRRALSDRAVAMARRLTDPATIAEVLILRSDTIARPDTLAERLALADEELVLTEQLGEPSLLIRALVNAVMVAFEAGRIDLVDERLDRAVRLTDQISQPLLRWLVMQQRAKRLTMEGRFEEASAAAGEAFELGQAAGQPEAPLVFAGQHFLLCMFQGRHEEMLPLMEDAAGDDTIVPAVLVVQARMMAEAGRVEAARELLEKALAEGIGWLPDDSTRLTIASLIALTAYLLEMPEVARTVVPVLRPYPGHVAADRMNVGGSVAHYLGLASFTIGELEDAERWLSEAIDVHRRMGAVPLMAFTQYDLARTLHERGWAGDRPRLTVLAEEARATAEELGMPVLARNAATLASLDG